MFGQGYSARLVHIETADVARRLRDANLKSVWRALPDGSVQLARPRRGRVELYTVRPGGASELTERSDRSMRKAIADPLAGVGGAAFVAGILGGMIFSPDFLMLMVVGWLTLLVAPLLAWRSHVRPWIRVRFGTDEDWAIIPWRIDGAPRTGNQAITMSGVVSAGGGQGRYRVTAEGSVELLTKGGKQSFRIDQGGTAVETPLPDARWLRDAELKGQDEWHEVLTYDPTD